MVRLPTAAASDTQRTANQLLAENEGSLAIAEWDDNDVRFVNALAGYILVWGYNYRVEIVSGSPTDYQAALPSADVHVALQADPEWVENAGAAVIDLGPLAPGGAGPKIVATADLKATAPEVVDFLKNIDLSEETIGKYSARMTGGRIGVNAVTAALIYLDEREEEWTSWVSDEVATNVKTAVDGGKTNLINRLCFPTGYDEQQNGPCN